MPMLYNFVLFYFMLCLVLCCCFYWMCAADLCRLTGNLALSTTKWAKFHPLNCDDRPKFKPIYCKSVCELFLFTFFFASIFWCTLCCVRPHHAQSSMYNNKKTESTNRIFTRNLFSLSFSHSFSVCLSFRLFFFFYELKRVFKLSWYQ